MMMKSEIRGKESAFKQLSHSSSSAGLLAREQGTVNRVFVCVCVRVCMVGRRRPSIGSCVDPLTTVVAVSRRRHLMLQSLMCGNTSLAPVRGTRARAAGSGTP